MEFTTSDRGWRWFTALRPGRWAAGLPGAGQWLDGLVINGGLRDSAELRELVLGIRPFSTVPRRSSKEGRGERGIPVSFAGVVFSPGGFIYADTDGLIVSGEDLLA